MRQARCTACKLRIRIRGRMFCKECIESFHQKNGIDIENEDPEYEFTKEFNKEVDEDDEC
ncbi:hypothetical protein KY338_01700 [Candidatus Woesearchaeota archaeon]|nr:hypothetical protein [Candidatus Woesearchaeota archaeon]MBW3005626.1 hypothetical protein [Candidatus Woesearchaeota archaeon]